MWKRPEQPTSAASFSSDKFGSASIPAQTVWQPSAGSITLCKAITEPPPPEALSGRRSPESPGLWSVTDPSVLLLAVLLKDWTSIRAAGGGVAATVCTATVGVDCTAIGGVDCTAIVGVDCTAIVGVGCTGIVGVDCTAIAGVELVTGLNTMTGDGTD